MEKEVRAQRVWGRDALGGLGESGGLLWCLVGCMGVKTGDLGVGG